MSNLQQLEAELSNFLTEYRNLKHRYARLVASNDIKRLSRMHQRIEQAEAALAVLQAKAEKLSRPKKRVHGTRYDDWIESILSGE